MTLYIVSTPIGNLEDVTIRALGVLRDVERVYAEDTRRSRVLLDRHGIGTPLRSLHEHNEAARTGEILDLLRQGSKVALVSDAGTPLVSDPGARVVRAAIDEGCRVVPVPGASAVLAALVASGLDASRFTFLGFLPRKASARQAELDAISGAVVATVLFEAPGRLTGLLSELAQAVGPERVVAVARELTKLHEDVFRGTLAEALAYYQERPPKGEVTVVLGPPDDEERARRGREAHDAARAHAVSSLAAGARPSDVVRDVVDRFGLAKNAAYRLVQEQRRESGS